MAGVRDETAVKLIGHVARASVVWNILALDKPYQTDNAQVDQRMKGPFVMREGIVSSVGVPLREGALKVGVAFFNYRKYHRFTDEEMVNIELFSDQAAVAIRIVQLFRKEQRLHEELQKKFEELTRTNKLVASRSALAWMGMASSTWRHAIEKHALTIKDQVKLLRMQIQRGEIQTEKIEVRLTSIEKMASFIMEKPITPPLSNEEGVGPVEINQLVKERMMALWKNEPYSLVELNFDLKLDDQARVRASSEWLRRALDILVDNAVEATAGQERRKMTVSTNPNGDRIEIAVRDSGLGIPDHIREYFLVSPVPKGEGEKGLGLGLLLAQTIVQTYGGEIQLGPSDSSGTTMIIALPLLV
jgi:C4-dicarboxylate-specific signal transduction histidine kinase